MARANLGSRTSACCGAGRRREDPGPDLPQGRGCSLPLCLQGWFEAPGPFFSSAKRPCKRLLRAGPMTDSTPFLSHHARISTRQNPESARTQISTSGQRRRICPRSAPAPRTIPGRRPGRRSEWSWRSSYPSTSANTRCATSRRSGCSTRAEERGSVKHPGDFTLPQALISSLLPLHPVPVGPPPSSWYKLLSPQVLCQTRRPFPMPGMREAG